MKLEHKFLITFKDWLNETAEMVDYLIHYDEPKLANTRVKTAVKKTKGKRKYTKRSEFWKHPHPRKK